MKKYALLPGLVLCAVLVVTIVHYASASTESSEAMPSVVLIQEIRNLRKSLETLAASNARSQFAIERCRLQQTVVANLTDQINLVQSAIDANEDLMRQQEQSLKDLETALPSDDEQSKIQTERERKATVKNIDINRMRGQTLQDRKAQLEASFQAEKQKLEDLTQALEVMARETVIPQK
jgi:hypothetical protein